MISGCNSQDVSQCIYKRFLILTVWLIRTDECKGCKRVDDPTIKSILVSLWQAQVPHASFERSSRIQGHDDHYGEDYNFTLNQSWTCKHVWKPSDWIRLACYIDDSLEVSEADESGLSQIHHSKIHTSCWSTAAMHGHCPTANCQTTWPCEILKARWHDFQVHCITLVLQQTRLPCRPFATLRHS